MQEAVLKGRRLSCGISWCLKALRNPCYCVFKGLGAKPYSERGKLLLSSTTQDKAPGAGQHLLCFLPPNGKLGLSTGKEDDGVKWVLFYFVFCFVFAELSQLKSSMTKQKQETTWEKGVLGCCWLKLIWPQQTNKTSDFRREDCGTPESWKNEST